MLDSCFQHNDYTSIITILRQLHAVNDMRYCYESYDSKKSIDIFTNEEIDTILMNFNNFSMNTFSKGEK